MNRMRMGFILAGWGLSLMVIGCGRPYIHPNPALLAGEQPVQYDDADYALLLTRHVRAGLVDYRGLKDDRLLLERYYARVSQVGPDSTPAQFVTRAQRTAYWINVYNALVLRAVVQRYPVKTMYDLNLPRLESEYTFMVDGREYTLWQIEEQMLTDSDTDVRTLFATCRAAVGTPRLADVPYRPSALERQLDEAVVRSMENPHLLHIDHGRQAILVWQQVLRRQADFIEYWRKRHRGSTIYIYNVLCALAGPARQRALESAVGYDIREISFDRRLNDANLIKKEPPRMP